MGVLGRWILIAIIWSFLRKLKGSGIIEFQVGFFAMFTNLFGNVVIFVPFGFFYAHGEQIQKLLFYIVL